MRGMFHKVGGVVSALVATAALVFGMQALSLGQGPGKDKDVRVVNTAADPVPTVVQGAVAAVVQGTPSVGISPRANVVTIGNSAGAPALVRDVDRPSGEPFKYKFEAFINGGDQYSPSPSYTVPAGKRLFIQYVSLEGYLPQSQRMLFGITVAINNQGTIHFVSANHQGTFKDGASHFEEFVISQPVTIFIDAGFDVQPFVRRSESDGSGHYEGTIFGYLQDVP